MKLRAINFLSLFIVICMSSTICSSQININDPLDFDPLYLSRGTGAVWGVGATIASLLLFKKKNTEQNKLTPFVTSGISFGYDKPYSTAYSMRIGVLYKVRKNLHMGLALHPIYFDHDVQSTFSLGPRVFSKWHLINKEKYRIYFQYGAGMTWNINEFPARNPNGDQRQGTHFNFTPSYSLGTDIRLNKQLRFLFAIRHQHLSNAELFGKERNPGYDSNGIHIGIILDEIK